MDRVDGNRVAGNAGHTLDAAARTAGAYMKDDLVQRLRRWTHAVDAAPASDLMDEAAREIEMLKTALARIASQDATFSVIGGNIIVDVDAKLTDDEREAIKRGALACEFHGLQKSCATLRALLARLP